MWRLETVPIHASALIRADIGLAFTLIAIACLDAAIYIIVQRRNLNREDKICM